MKKFYPKIALLFISLIFSSLTMANFPQFFGSSPTTMSIGGQFNGNPDDPSNAFYNSAVLAFSQNLNFSLGLSNVTRNFNDINSIVIRNPTNSTSGTYENGKANTDYSEVKNMAVNIALPLLKGGTLGFSLSTPIETVMETNSGDPFLPEYVMHRARYNRTQMSVHYAHLLGDYLALSIGTNLGFSTNGRMNGLLNVDNDTSIDSNGSTKIKVEQEVAGVFSLLVKTEKQNFYLTYNQELKQNFSIINLTATGRVPSISSEMTFETMSYYDPAIFRIGHITKFSFMTTMISLDYEQWENYSSPTLNILKKEGMIKSSSKFETLELQNIWVPKIGATFWATETLGLSVGYSQRNSPLLGNFSGAGNSVDTNSKVYTTGLETSFTLFDKKVTASGAFQYHQLEEKTVIKTTGIENGSGGQKLGSPGYTIGGDIYVLSFGLKVLL